jgi:hypothetical protein
MATFEIKNRWTGAIMFTEEGDSLKAVLQRLVLSGSDLSGSDLSALDPQIAGIICAPIASHMFFRDGAEVMGWLKDREYAK